MTLQIIDATPRDAQAIAVLLGGYAHEVDWLPITRSGAEDIAAADTMIARGWVRVACQAGRLAGFLAREAQHIHALYTVPERRGQGIGAQLLADAQRSCRELTLWTAAQNLGAARFYRRAGFEVTHLGDPSENDEGVPELWFRWQAQGDK